MKIAQKQNQIVYKNGKTIFILCLFFFLFLTYWIVLYLLDGETIKSLIRPIIMDIFALIGMGYQESWTFDNKKHLVTSRFGVFPLIKMNTYAYNDIATMEISHFTKGYMGGERKEDPKKRKNRAHVNLGLRMNDYELKPIEVIAEKRSAGMTESAATVISSFTGFPLTVDRPRDMDLNVGIKDL